MEKNQDHQFWFLYQPTYFIMQLKYFYIVWLLTILLLPNQSIRAQIDVKLNNNQVFRYDLKKGSFSLIENNIPVFENAVSIFQLKNQGPIEVKSSNARALKQKFKDQVGSGTCYSIEHPLANGIKAIQNFYFYEKNPSFILELVVKGKNISSNNLIPISLKTQQLFVGNPISTISIPFDNDTFISYHQNELGNQPYQSAEVGILYDKTNQKGLIAASLDQSTWKTGILANKDSLDRTDLQVVNGFTDVNITRDSIKHGFVNGNIIKSSKILIALSNNWQDGMESYAKLQKKLFPPNIKGWTGATPIGWNSWGVIQDKLSWENATGNVDYFKNKIPNFRNESGKAFIDLDSFWDNMVPGGMGGDYSKLKEFVNYCKAAGLEPGAYWAPFTDWGYKSGPNRKAEGSDYVFAELWTKTDNGFHDLDGGRALDPTHPGTQARMKFILEKLKDCGFKMIKIDFLSHASIESTSFFDPNTTTGMQAYAVGMKYLNEVLDNQMLIYAAISPSIATYKYAHMRRIACDAWKTMEQTAYTLNSVTFGWWQTFLYDFIDADHVVFTGESHNTNIARLLSAVVAGPIILGDDFSKYEEWQTSMEPILQNPEILQIGKNGKSFKPLQVILDNKTSNLYLKHDAGQLYLIAFNFKDENLTLTYDLNKEGFDGKFKIKDLISQEETSIDPKINITFQTSGAKIFKLTPEL